MREEAKDTKRDKCPGCGKMCTGRTAMWKTIDGVGFPIFAYACARCGAQWVKACIPKTAEKIS